jgi:hypothetical protein
MKRALRLARKHVFSPLHTVGSALVSVQVELWNGKFDEVWMNTSISQKLSWMLFASNTIAILTALEILLLHK